MTQLGSLGPSRLRAALAEGELAVEIGPFRARIHSDVPSVSEHLDQYYGGYPLVEPEEMADFQVVLTATKGLRRWVKGQVRFFYQSVEPFQPLPIDQAMHAFEWGLNWAIAAQISRFLMFHAATLERDGQAILLPAHSGSGKSTLCAALVQHGWRLLSDEFALLSLDGSRLHGMGRPISLKNQSIEIVRRHYPKAEISTPVSGTRKGTVAMLAPPKGAVAVGDVAAPRWIIAPRYESNANPNVIPIEKAKMAFYLMDQSFNYQRLKGEGFELLCRLVQQCDSVALSYATLDQALSLVEQVTAAKPAAAQEAPLGAPRPGTEVPAVRAGLL